MQYDSLKQMPAGGLASFLTSNMDEIEDNVLAFGAPRGINSMTEVGNRMAMMGRNGDDQLVHMRTGEIAVSPELLEENPRLAGELADAFDRSNVDMARYEVGNPANSINPMTGQREFFLKKLIGGIKDIFKKIAPVIVPIGLNLLFPGLGAVYSGALGSGITTLAQGGNFQDALKSAAMGGLAGGVFAGFKTGFKGQPFREAAFGTRGQRFTLNPEVKSFFTDAESGILSGKGKTDTAPAPKQGGLLKYLNPGRDVPTTEAILDSELYKQLRLDGNPNAFNIAKEQLMPGAISRYGPLALAGTAVLGAAGGFETPKENLDDFPFGISSQELYDQDPSRYSVFAGYNMPTPMSRVGQPIEEDDRNYLFENYLQPTAFAADGGAMDRQNFPRRQGAIAGPGTETSDDIPAMLSDGEFVMTARAVRGAGNGSRKQGVKKMYDMMRAFEGGVVA